MATAVLGSASAQTITYTVDCSKGQTIASAIERGDARKPLVVLIRGTCNEHVSISRDDVTLRGEPGTGATVNGPSATTDTIVILKDTVNIEDLTVTGGFNGIRLQGPSYAGVKNVYVRNTANNGIVVRAGDIAIENSTVEYAGGSGLALQRGASARIFNNSQFRNSHSAGINASNNSTVSVNGGTISANVTGVLLFAGSHGSFSGVTISENTETGIKVAYSQAIIGGNNVISSNANWGIWVLNGSSAAINGNRIEDNGLDGVSGDIGSTLTMIGNQIRRNGTFGISCRTNCTMANQGDTIENNGAGGILLGEASILIFSANPTHWSGDGWGLRCIDKESSVAGLELFDGTVSETCTDFNN
jgi:hypothetical protein